MKSTKLYCRGSFGINEWQIWGKNDVIQIRANGCAYESKVVTNNSGRSMEEQVQLEINARIEKKLNQGFKRRVEDLEEIRTNQLGLASPMLATPLKRISHIGEDVYQQVKLDGHRCLISKRGAYSRGGKEINTIPEILDSLNLPEEAILDGELYAHRVPLQTIASWAKRRQPNTLKLKYMVYDVIVPGMPYIDRRALLKELDLTNEFVKTVISRLIEPGKDVMDYCREYKSHGFEGAILRTGQGLYEPGIRSKGLIKVKLAYDAEYICVDINPSKEGWGVLTLRTPDGEYFETSAPGDHNQKRYCLNHKEEYLNRFVTCEYAELTKRGVPFHCVAIRWLASI